VREVVVAEGEPVNALHPVSAGRYVALSVEDTGHGIPPEVREHIFEPFFTTKPEGRGTGLGLSTVFGIVEQSGGGVRVDSEPGRGTRFEILFPRVEAAAPRAASVPSAANADPDRENEGDRARATILVVDDTAAVLRVTRRLLERAGYAVMTATNGGEALETMAEHEGEIALVLSDIVMPDVGGAALLDQVLEKWPGVRVVLTSGHADDEIALEAVRRATAFLPKPYRAAELVGTVREVLEGRPSDS
jgi:two-component system cell cycle sensor histidine kinase/response regulator CckA